MNIWEDQGFEIWQTYFLFFCFFLNFILFYFLFLFVVDFDKPIFKLQLHHCLILETLFNLQVLISISGIIMSTQ